MSIKVTSTFLITAILSFFEGILRKMVRRGKAYKRTKHSTTVDQPSSASAELRLTGTRLTTSN